MVKFCQQWRKAICKSKASQVRPHFSAARKRNWYYHYSLAEQPEDVTISLQVTPHDNKTFKE
tara:strand:- start:2878 stop:3063 length:186 start_codon:yes stop_codon:yes gene_type:complete